MAVRVRVGRGARTWAAKWGAIGRPILLAVAWAVVSSAVTSAQQPLTAEDAMRIALERSPATLRADQDVVAASGLFTTARSQILPQLNMSLGYDHSRQSSFSNFLGERVVFESESYDGNASIDQTIVSFDAWGRIRSASSTRGASREGRRATRADIALGAFQQFYALLKAQKLATVAGQSLQLTRDQLRRTQALFELGSVARGDVLKQQVQVSQAELDDIAARRAIQVEEARLASVLGLPYGQTVSIDTTLTVVQVDFDSAAVWQEASQRRPEIARARAQLASAQSDLGAAQGARYPSLFGNLSYGFRKQSPFPNSFDEVDANSARSVSLRMQVPLFDGLSTKGRIRLARARKLQAEYALRQAELNIGIDVAQALQAASQAREGIRVANDGLAAAEEDLKLSQEKYNVGSATVIELIDAQVALTRARSNLISALADAHVAELQLRRARGESF